MAEHRQHRTSASNLNESNALVSGYLTTGRPSHRRTDPAVGTPAADPSRRRSFWEETGGERDGRRSSSRASFKDERGFLADFFAGDGAEPMAQQVRKRGGVENLDSIQRACILLFDADAHLMGEMDLCADLKKGTETVFRLYDQMQDPYLKDGTTPKWVHSQEVLRLTQRFFEKQLGKVLLFPPISSLQ